MFCSCWSYIGRRGSRQELSLRPPDEKSCHCLFNVGWTLHRMKFPACLCTKNLLLSLAWTIFSHCLCTQKLWQKFCKINFGIIYVLFWYMICSCWSYIGSCGSRQELSLRPLDEKSCHCLCDDGQTGHRMKFPSIARLCTKKSASITCVNNEKSCHCLCDDGRTLQGWNFPSIACLNNFSSLSLYTKVVKKMSQNQPWNNIHVILL